MVVYRKNCRLLQAVFYSNYLILRMWQWQGGLRKQFSMFSNYSGVQNGHCTF